MQCLAGNIAIGGGGQLFGGKCSFVVEEEKGCFSESYPSPQPSPARGEGESAGNPSSAMERGEDAGKTPSPLAGEGWGEGVVSPTTATLIGRCERKRSCKKAKGSILVEFAIGVPALIACAIVMHDAPKYARMESKMEFIGHTMINMLQNVSQNRQNKKITKQDYAYIVYAAFLAYYGGGTRQYTTGDGLNADYYFPHPVLFCIQGQANGKAKILWIMHPTWYKYPNTYNAPTTRNLASDHTHSEQFSIIKTNLATEVNPTDIMPTFSIKPGEIKMILDVAFYSNNPTEAAKHFGFWMLRPKPRNIWSFFNTLIVFTPKPGLFDETAPTN